MTTHRLTLLAALISCLPACASHSSYVDTEDAALGRVVVYRNGIAYYERRAHVMGDSLTLSVPHDKVDDFLKSLTVKHAKTGEAVPIAYPTRGATRADIVDMAIRLPGPGPHDLIITYITEAPAWKPSYRVVVGEDKIDVQGWAIVDNTSGEDWESVRVGVGSSSALSFRYDLRSVVNVHRETLGERRLFAQAPPTGTTATRSGPRAPMVLAHLAESSLPVPVGHPEAEEAQALGGIGFAGLGSGGGGIASGRLHQEKEPKSKVAKSLSVAKESAPHRDLSKISALARKLQGSVDSLVIEGYASVEEDDAQGASLDRAHRLRNALIARGVAPDRLQVAALGNVDGKKAGVEIKVAESGALTDTEHAGDPVGESHFESTTPMTIERGTSAMVSIMSTATPGQVVYLYAPDDKRGHERFAFKAVRFDNPTDSTLETGPVTVYGDGRFIGEGLTDAVPPGSTTLVPFALDRQIVVERSRDTSDRISSLIKVSRGVCTAEMQHSRTTKFTVTNRMKRPTRLFIRHAVRKGWSLEESPDVFERRGEEHLFDIALEGGESRTVTVVEATPLERQVDLRSELGIDLLRTYLSANTPDPKFAATMADLLALYETMHKEREAIVTLQEQISEYRKRNNELHIQIASLKLVRVRGELMTHLKRKMRQTSERVQEATIAVVNHKERLMLSRIRFQDGLSDLSLQPVADTASRQDEGTEEES